MVSKVSFQRTNEEKERKKERNNNKKKNERHAIISGTDEIEQVSSSSQTAHSSYYTILVHIALHFQVETERVSIWFTVALARSLVPLSIEVHQASICNNNMDNNYYYSCTTVVGGA